MKQGFSSKWTRTARKNILRKLSGKFSYLFTIRNFRIEQKEYLRGEELAPPGGADEYQKIRESNNAVIKENCGISHNNFSRTVYLTISTQIDTPDDACGIFEASDPWVKELLRGCKGVIVNKSIPPKMSISNFMGYLKGKSALIIYDKHPKMQSKWNQAFWARGYYVATIGNVTEEAIKRYIPTLSSQAGN